MPIVRKKRKEKESLLFHIIFAHHVLWSRIGKTEKKHKDLENLSRADHDTLPSSRGKLLCTSWLSLLDDTLNCLFVFCTTHPPKVVTAFFIHVSLRKKKDKYGSISFHFILYEIMHPVSYLYLLNQNFQNFVPCIKVDVRLFFFIFFRQFRCLMHISSARL